MNALMNGLKITRIGNIVQVRDAGGRMLSSWPSEDQATAWAAGYDAGHAEIRREVAERLGAVLRGDR